MKRLIEEMSCEKHIASVQSMNHPTVNQRRKLKDGVFFSFS